MKKPSGTDAGTPALLRIHPDDNVAVALRPLPAGSSWRCGPAEVRILSDIPAAHKIALAGIRPGETVRKYGYPIGTAAERIEPGGHVHTHNLRSGLDGLAHAGMAPGAAVLPGRTAGRGCFPGYLRSDGRAGIRNEVWILPTVGCIQSVVSQIEDAARPFLPAGVDGLHGFRHPYGCSQLGEDQERTLRLLTGLARHPNAGGVLVVGLGCENAPVRAWRKQLGDLGADRIRYLVCQDEPDEVAAGVAAVRELFEQARNAVRTPCPLSDLVVGLKCGGSDGFSGITANPVVGAFSDRYAEAGGSLVLSEVPEMFGAEDELLNRCRTPDVRREAVRMIEGFKDYFRRYGQPVGENPSPGNRDGGITTLEEKSLGCVQKAGQVVVEDILDYGAQVRIPGLSLLRAPGNDLVSSCALAAAGAQMILFTTGRGTPFGSLVPTLKIASHSGLARAKPHWIDFDAGPVLDGTPPAVLAEALLQQVMEVAAGSVKTRSEALDRRDLALFKDGVTL